MSFSYKGGGVDLGGGGVGRERPIIMEGINRKWADLLHLFSFYFFVGGWPLAWSDLLK